MPDDFAIAPGGLYVLSHVLWFVVCLFSQVTHPDSVAMSKRHMVLWSSDVFGAPAEGALPACVCFTWGFLGLGFLLFLLSGVVAPLAPVGVPFLFFVVPHSGGVGVVRSFVWVGLHFYAIPPPGGTCILWMFRASKQVFLTLRAPHSAL